MDKLHNKALQKLRSHLVKSINPDMELNDQMADERIFTKQMIEKIQSGQTQSARCRIMLDMLPQRGPNAYRIFLEYLRESGHKFVADTIEQKERELRYPNMVCSGPSTQGTTQGQNQGASIDVADISSTQKSEEDSAVDNDKNNQRKVSIVSPQQHQ
ncbi:caspase-2-like [Argopecten irradians]|uniref:caspase-2-like n=1 Tax=Argopecten irradians TaxID=31199 RepID=UPI003713C02A